MKEGWGGREFEQGWGMGPVGGITPVSVEMSDMWREVSNVAFLMYPFNKVLCKCPE